MKAGDKLYCYNYNKIRNGVCDWNFTVGKWYKIYKIDTLYTSIFGNLYTNTFPSYEIKLYFRTEKEERKLKLEKLK